MESSSIAIFSPATIANLSCGFDVLGLALEGIGDRMTVGLTPEPGVRITRITGANLPYGGRKKRRRGSGHGPASSF